MHWICFGICWAMGAKGTGGLGTGDWGPPGGVVEQKSRQSVACIEFHWFMFHMSRLWGRDSLKAGAWHNRGMSTGWAAGWRSKSSGRVTMQWLHLLSIYVQYTHTPPSPAISVMWKACLCCCSKNIFSRVSELHEKRWSGGWVEVIW